LHDADGGKDIARRAAELCGGALNQRINQHFQEFHHRLS